MKYRDDKINIFGKGAVDKLEKKPFNPEKLKCLVCGSLKPCNCTVQDYNKKVL